MRDSVGRQPKGIASSLRKSVADRIVDTDVFLVENLSKGIGKKKENQAEFRAFVGLRQATQL